MTKPKTQYTKSGRINIAYQVFGSGDVDLVYIPGWISNIDLIWSCPELVDFLSELGKYTRVILFDKRGTGLSDRVSDLSTLEERMDDIRAVMDATGTEKAVLFGHSEGGSVSALFAATYPHRTISLITFGVFAKRRYSPDYPWAPTGSERQKVYDMIETSWGSNEMNLETLAPSMANNQVFMEWLATYFRSGASPSAALVLTKMNTQVDIIDILDTIEVPTLLLYRTDDIDVKVEEGKFINQRIKGSKFVEFPGNDHLFWVGDSKAVLDEMIHFMRNERTETSVHKILATILSIKIKNLHDHRALYGDQRADDHLERAHAIIENKVRQYRGSIAKTSDIHTTATFEGPSKAVHCAMEIRKAIKSLGVHVAQGVHIGECQFTDEGAIGGSAITIANDILARASESEILISNTVQNLLSGAGLDFAHHSHVATTNERMVQTLILTEMAEEPEPKRSPFQSENPISGMIKNHSFLENVLQSIGDHLTDEQYTIEVLCEEVGMGQRQLQRKLRSITNKSPNQLVRSVRLHRAKELIVQQSKSITEAAFDTGFSSLSYFTKCFKKEFGYSPSQLRATED